MKNSPSFSQQKKKWRTTIRELLTKAGFTVVNVRIAVDHYSDPGIGHLVTLRGKETPALRKLAEGTLWNYAYNIKFVSI